MGGFIMKNLTELVFILDRSGSMAGLEGDTIGGFNAMIEKQKNTAFKTLVCMVLFDHVSKLIQDLENICKILSPHPACAVWGDLL